MVALAGGIYGLTHFNEFVNLCIRPWYTPCLKPHLLAKKPGASGQHHQLYSVEKEYWRFSVLMAERRADRH